MNKLFKSIRETQKALVEKEISAAQLVKTYLERIEKHDSELNSFITVTEEAAFAQAKKVDQLIKDKGKEVLKEYPLLGVVMAYKDLFLTQGVRTTAGAKVLENYIPQYSATVFEKLNQAGSIMIGKTNCDAWAHGASGENSDFGPTKNPWDKTHVPGGSSSGSAVAVAANLALAATGTDTGGSIRLPASFCNLVGLKPTYGAVSRYGVVAMASSLDSMGHFTHTVEDSEIIFNLTKGQDNKDATLKNGEYQKSFKGKLKIGIPQEYFVSGIDPEVKKAVLKASRVLEKQGFELVEISLPHTKYAISVYYLVMSAEVSSNLARYDGIRYGQDRSFFRDEARRRLMLGSFTLSVGYYDAYYRQAQKVRTKLVEDFEKAFKKADILLAPVSPTPPFKIGEKVDDPLTMYLCDVFTATVNLAGLPGLALPCGFTNKGLPIGFQLLGPRFSEKILFEVGKKYQTETEWQNQEPKL